mmetsp:Transcript_36103/g.76996  ORF Transcript_36103/g.76996 Transcript_36103/m.76996 type:complete len:201 (+) Transcript_36103:791-1393(+)
MSTQTQAWYQAAPDEHHACKASSHGGVPALRCRLGDARSPARHLQGEYRTGQRYVHEAGEGSRGSGVGERFLQGFRRCFVPAIFGGGSKVLSCEGDPDQASRRHHGCFGTEAEARYGSQQRHRQQRQHCAPRPRKLVHPAIAARVRQHVDVVVGGEQPREVQRRQRRHQAPAEGHHQHDVRRRVSMQQLEQFVARPAAAE